LFIVFAPLAAWGLRIAAPGVPEVPPSTCCWVRGEGDTPVAVCGELGDSRKPLDGRARLALGARIDMTTASVEDLDALPGIGRERALAIVALRAERGGLRGLEDLLVVRGIGPATLDAISDYVTFEPEPCPKAWWSQ
jgi:competence ComEA-like helix-hairpin-helix protein